MPTVTQLILASQSPRRQKILADMGYHFSVVSADVEEVQLVNDPEKTVCVNAGLKLEWVRARHDSATIISADTVIQFNGQCLGKPESLAQAKDWFAEFSGREQKVITAMGFCTEGVAPCIKVDVAVIRFRQLNSQTITHYLDKVNPLDKAGGYNIGEHGDIIIESYMGSKNAIMGLCVESLQPLLKKTKNSEQWKKQP